MPQGIDLSQRHEFHDAAGRVVGYYIPATEPRRAAESPATANGGTLSQRSWEQICQALTVERDRLRAEVEVLRAECDQYRRAVLALTQETFTFDKEALLSLDPVRPTLEQVISELEQSLGTHHA